MIHMLAVFTVFAVIITGCDTSTKQSDSVPSKESVLSEARGAVRKPLDGDVVIHMTINKLPDGNIRLDGTTNLPTNTELMLSIEERMEGGFLGQTKSTVDSDGSFSSETLGPTGGLKDGSYTAEIFMPIPSVQPADVRRVIGENGENLSGMLVKNGAVGITLSKKTEFTIGGAQAIQIQKQRSKDEEKFIERLKFDICVQLERLLKFKDKKDFKTYGFGRGGQYHKWLMDVEALRDLQSKSSTYSVPFPLKAATGELIILGMEYIKKQRETDYIGKMLQELQETIDYADYLVTKNQHGRNSLQ